MWTDYFEDNILKIVLSLAGWPNFTSVAHPFSMVGQQHSRPNTMFAAQCILSQEYLFWGFNVETAVGRKNGSKLLERQALEMPFWPGVGRNF